MTNADRPPSVECLLTALRRRESVGLVVRGPSPTAPAVRLRAGDPPVIGRVESGAVLLDLRTVDQRDDAAFAGARVRSLTTG